AVTGDRIPDAPDSISEAPRTMTRLTEVGSTANGEDKAERERKREPKRNERDAKYAHAQGHAQPSGGGFFLSGNAAAMARLDDGISALLPAARKYPNGAWRVRPADTGRPEFMEDFSAHPDGIRNYGPEEGLTPIDTVLEFGSAPDAIAAAMWL